VVVSEAREIPPAKCFTEEVTRSADSLTCLTLPPNSRSKENNSTEGGVQQPLASITCGKDTTIPPEKLGSCPDAQATLDAHNAARARWGAAPLLWSKTLSDYAQTVSNTCNFAHSNGPYGENLAIGSSLTCKGSLDLWVAEQAQWPPGGTPGFSSATGHFSQVVWKSATQVGCATRSCNGRNFVTCSYNPPGNVIGQFNTQVGYQGQTPECTATTTPGTPSVPPPTARSSPPPPPTPRVPPPSPTTVTRSPPPPLAVTRSPPPPAPPSGRCCYFNICFSC
jgi:pathogenesis-related protein 1